MAGASVGEIRARLILESQEFSNGVDRARQQMDGMGRSAASLSSQMGLVQKAALAVGGAVATGVGAATNAAANFEQQMSAVKAVSGASGAEMQQLTDLAIKLGESTSFSATETAKATEELVKAGVSVTDIINGGLSGALDLAAAGNLDLADAAEIASTALNAFRDDNLKVVDAANILAGAANASATDVGELKYGLSQVSAVASGVGMSFKDTSTALAVFAQNGLKGSDAGTSLKTMLANLQPSTKAQIELFHDLGLLTDEGTSKFFDQAGSLKSLSEISDILRKSMKGMTDEQRQWTLQTIFGSDAVRGATILYKEGADGVNKMWEAMSKVTAADVAKTKLDNLKGSFEEFSGAMETLGIKIGNEFLPTFRQIVDSGTAVVRVISDINPGITKTGIEMVGTAAGIALVASSAVKLAAAMRGLFVSMGPAGWIITGLSILGGLLVGVKEGYDAMNTVSLEAANAKQQEIESIDSLASQFDKLKNKTRLTADEFARYLDINDQLKTETDPEVIKRLKDEQDGLRKNSGLTNDEFDTFLKLNDKVIKTSPDTEAAISSQGNAVAKNTDALKRLNEQKAEELRLELEKQKNLAEKNYDENLERRRNITKEINDLTRDRKRLEADVAAQIATIESTEKRLTQAKADGNEKEAASAQTVLDVQKGTLKNLRGQLDTIYGKINAKNTELNKVNEEIGKLDKVKQKMIDLELRQVGLNAKRGQGVNVINKEIARLKDARANLANNTSAADKKTKEYRDSVSAIDKEISQLQSAKRRVQEITKEAESMNEKLARRISKKIHVTYSADGTEIEESAETFKKTHGKGGQEVPFHVGGIVGRGQINKLHTGGLASKFDNPPMSHEVDIRALRNEMVLTEAQQANLMRMIDAGHTAGLGGSIPEMSRLAAAIESLSRKEIRVVSQIGGKTLADETYPFFNQKMTGDLKRELRSMGVKE
ncbi:phage tail tape measure protein [Bacillus sonorensis]|uniref:phage tail tape measure protein n=1 Tax=Bacillus sonorensis TaxID=119858 RepID=UPI002DB8221F|nr:phage tail tape measure protein [Bacillus sonorensis]MEC1426621.1 phage tail tape measure protein [Bacillus sonorensis]